MLFLWHAQAPQLRSQGLDRRQPHQARLQLQHRAHYPRRRRQKGRRRLRLQPVHRRAQDILDVTISCPTCPTYICNAAAASNDHCTKLAEKNKYTKYDDLASKLDCRVVAAAFTTYGGRGDDFKKTLVDPYHKKEFKAARKNGESGWAVINDRLRYERHVSLSSAVRILACSA